jgi:hypothetical protein
MVHKSRLIPGLSQFIDNNILSHYPPTSMKRILCAGGVSLYLSKGDAIVDTLLQNPMISGLGVTSADGMVNLELLRDTLKREISKAGYMRVSFPIVGDVDFTVDDVDSLYGYICGPTQPTLPTQPQIRQPEVY